MGLGKIRTCLICEEAREEKYRKFSLLGVYGIAPTNILMQNIPGQIDRLTFVFFGGPSSGQTKIRFKILRPDGSSLIELPPSNIELPKQEALYNLIITASSIRFENSGDYKFELLVDDQSWFSSAIRVDKGDPEAFR